jgi:hypothetical protein
MCVIVRRRPGEPAEAVDYFPETIAKVQLLITPCQSRLADARSRLFRWLLASRRLRGHHSTTPAATIHCSKIAISKLRWNKLALLSDC